MGGEGPMFGQHSTEGGDGVLDRVALAITFFGHLPYEIQQVRNYSLIAETSEYHHHVIDIWKEQQDAAFQDMVNEFEGAVECLEC